MIRVLPIIDPVFVKHHQRMDTIATILDGQFNTRQQVDVLLLRGFPKGFEFIPVEFVVVGDDAHTDICLFQRSDIPRDKVLLGTSVLEFLSAECADGSLPAPTDFRERKNFFPQPWFVPPFASIF